ncbi:MAG: hypothetical protein ABIN96_10910 [Rubrivivax sp.]
MEIRAWSWALVSVSGRTRSSETAVHTIMVGAARAAATAGLWPGRRLRAQKSRPVAAFADRQQQCLAALRPDYLGIELAAFLAALTASPAAAPAEAALSAAMLAEASADEAALAASVIGAGVTTIAAGGGETTTGTSFLPQAARAKAATSEAVISDLFMCVLKIVCTGDCRRRQGFLMWEPPLRQDVDGRSPVTRTLLQAFAGQSPRNFTVSPWFGHVTISQFR